MTIDPRKKNPFPPGEALVVGRKYPLWKLCQPGTVFENEYHWWVVKRRNGVPRYFINGACLDDADVSRMYIEKRETTYVFKGYDRDHVEVSTPDPVRYARGCAELAAMLEEGAL